MHSGEVTLSAKYAWKKHDQDLRGKQVKVFLKSDYASASIVCELFCTTGSAQHALSCRWVPEQVGWEVERG